MIERYLRHTQAMGRSRMCFYQPSVDEDHAKRAGPQVCEMSHFEILHQAQQDKQAEGHRIDHSYHWDETALFFRDC